MIRMSTLTDNLVNQYNYPYDYLSLGKYVGAVVALWVASSLSILGSGTILFIRIRRRRREASTVYERLIVGISVVDLLMSSALFWNPVVLPKWTNLPFAKGTFGTCEWSGFFLYFFLGGTVYNGALATYFLLSVRYLKTERQIARILEPTVHVLALALPLVVGGIGLKRHAYNPHGLYGTCLLTAFPVECVVQDSGVACERGGDDTLLSLLVVGTQAIFGLGGAIITFVVYWTVRNRTHKVDNRFRASILMQQQQQQQQQQQLPMLLEQEDTTNTNSISTRSSSRRILSRIFQSSSSGLEDSSSSSPPEPSTRRFSCRRRSSSHAVLQAMDDAKSKRLRTVGMQAVCYILAYLNGFIWIVFANIVEAHYMQSTTVLFTALESGGTPLLYAAFWLLCFFFPLQGFFNALIYLRPRWIRWKDAYPTESWWWALKQVVTSREDIPMTPRTAHLKTGGGCRVIVAAVGGKKDTTTAAATNSSRTNDTMESPKVGGKSPIVADDAVVVEVANGSEKFAATTRSSELLRDDVAVQNAVDSGFLSRPSDIDPSIGDASSVTSGPSETDRDMTEKDCDDDEDDVEANVD